MIGLRFRVGRLEKIARAQEVPPAYDFHAWVAQLEELTTRSPQHAFGAFELLAIVGLRPMPTFAEIAGMGFKDDCNASWAQSVAEHRGAK
jgi:hypothetical protein